MRRRNRGFHTLDLGDVGSNHTSNNHQLWPQVSVNDSIPAGPKSVLTPVRRSDCSSLQQITHPALCVVTQSCSYTLQTVNRDTDTLHNERDNEVENEPVTT